MSLKYFHIAFIVITVLFFSGLAAWCFLVPGLPDLFDIMGWLSVISGITLLVYGVSFLKKVKTIIR